MVTRLGRKLTSFTGSLGVFIVFISIYLIIISIVGLHQPAWGDEEHFAITIRQFGQGITLDLLRTYGEMSTPLPFILYAVWGMVFGFALPVLRIFSLMIALITAILFWWLCYKFFGNAFSASVCAIFLFINPYMVGFSIFVFPDLLTILFLIIGLLALHEDKPILLGLACAAGLLSRQYFIFFPVAVMIYSAYKLWCKDSRQVKIIAAVALSTIPTLLLFWLWKGVSPQNSLKEIYLGYAFRFYPTALILYIILLGAYLSPLVLVRWKKYYKSLPMLAVALLASSIYFVYPVKASAPSLNSGITTVGYLHRFLSALLGGYANWVLYGLFLLSLPILFQVIKKWLEGFKQAGFEWLIRLAILLFLLIMPFSYLWWEKYFVLILPIAILEIYRPMAKANG